MVVMENLQTDSKLIQKKEAIHFLENALIHNHCIDIVFIMRNFQLNRKEFEECIKVAEQKLQLK